jgi:hypothetical protein
MLTWVVFIQGFYDKDLNRSLIYKNNGRLQRVVKVSRRLSVSTACDKGTALGKTNLPLLRLSFLQLMI